MDGGGIRKNGDFISQGLLEKVLAESEEVIDVFVYGVATADNAPGEKNIVAAVVPTDSGSFSADLLFDHCTRQLETSHIPDFIHVVEKIPKTASEKPQERFLLEGFQSETASVYSRRSA